MHVLLKRDMGAGVFLYCECGRILGMLPKPLNEEVMDSIVLGHREHVLMCNQIPLATRIGSTTQVSRPVDPMRPEYQVLSFDEQRAKIEELKKQP